ncbi:MAG TPA: glycerophosphodiester phosphodiesterase [Candidatus Saccharimonadales bacterium]|nr:glycerophosphodiester phosphodiesterase [Candidatus Saccharimonadales bacterium]
MTKVIGHRGARGLAPENTLAAIEAGIGAGADEIEIDVRVTRDGVPVLNHNPFLQDNQGNDMPHVRIHEQNYAELLTRKDSLATLEEAIRLANRRMPMIIEVKPKVHISPVVKTIQAFLGEGWQPGDFLLASFSQRTLRALHRELPQLEPIVLEHISMVIARMRAKEVGARRIGLNHHIVWWGLVSAVKRGEYQLSVHTLNDPRKARRWAKRGLYAIVTDYPARIKTALAEDT